MKRLGNLLNPNLDKDLGEIIGHARDMGELAQTLRASLPAAAAEALVAANVREDGELVVLTKSPGWAARLRFECDTLIAAARKEGAEIRSCSVRVSRDD
jgi:hypothetical protein